MSKNLSAGTYLPTTTRHVVSGAASISPTAPHSQVQNKIATISAACETPVLCPYSHGSAAEIVISSTRMNKLTTASGCAQLFDTSKLIPIGKRQAIHVPR